MLTTNSTTILIVDDQPMNLKLLFSFLQELGFKVLVAQTGESAIKKLKKVLPDLILLDVMLPELDGFETCKQLKASKKTKDIPVIFMTALSESMDKIKGLKVGAVDYITKPFQQEEVLARIENQLKIRRLSQQLEAQNKQLQQSQSLLESVLHTSQDGVMVFEAIRNSYRSIVDFKWILVNSAAERMVGRTADYLMKKRLLLELPGHRDCELFDGYVAVVETGMLQEGEYYYDADGIKAWFFIVAVKLGDGVAVTFRDITQHKQAEKALLDSERRFRAIFNNSFQYTGLLLPDGTVIEANQTVLDFGGIEHDDLIGRPLWEARWWNEGEQQQLKAAIARAAQGEFVRFEVEIRGVEDVLVTIDFSIKPVFDETGNVVLLIPEGRDISELKRAQETLLITQHRLEYLLSSNPSIIYSCQPIAPYATTFVSENITTLFGYTPQEFLENAEFWTSHIHPDDTERIFAELPKLFEQNQQANEYRFLHKDGTYRWVLDSLKLVRDETGNLIEGIGSMSDITQRKQVEAALQESQRWLSAITEANPNILYVHDLSQHKNIYINREVYTILGYTPEEVQHLGKAVLQTLMDSEDFAAVPEHFQRFETAKDGEILEFEYRMRHKNGEWRWLFSRETVFTRNAKGKPQQILGTATDISDRKQVELELKTAKTALEHQIQRVLLQERITQEIRSSLKPKQIFQIAANQIGQTFHASRCLIHTYIAHPIPRIPLVAEYLEPGCSSWMGLEMPVRGNAYAQLMLSQDKALKSDNVYQEPLLAGISDLLQRLELKSLLIIRTSYQGKPNGVIGLEQCDRFRFWTQDEIDLLEAVAVQLGIALAQANLLEQETQQRRELAQQNHALEKAKLEAEAANRAKSQFLSKMSHELRTPLNAILGFTQVMARDESLTTEHQDYVGIINRSGEHLLDLINDILSMSKIEAGQVSLNTTQFDLYCLLNSLEAMLGLKAKSKSLELIFERAPDVPQYIQTDDSKLRQVLINLLGNAIKFTQTGRVTLLVRVGIWEKKTVSSTLHLWFEVEDTGPGIAPEEMSTLFDPFVQTETGRQSMEGTGLGLTISQQFVRMMGGEISVSSTLNQGSIFTFDIQANWATSADVKLLSGKRRVIGLQPNQPSYRILIVEDAAVNRKLLVKILEPLGFEVRTANNGKEGVALWESWFPHLIWMDVIMPVMDGYEATRQIKQSPNGQNTVIIALTASAFEDQQDAILKAGCDDVLPKPFQREVLLEKIADYIGVHYIYEQPGTPTLPQSSASAKPPTPEALTVMPASWVAQLHQAALYADDTMMKQLIEQIPLEHDALRQALKNLINNFLLEEIINLTDTDSVRF